MCAFCKSYYNLVCNKPLPFVIRFCPFFSLSQQPLLSLQVFVYHLIRSTSFSFLFLPLKEEHLNPFLLTKLVQLLGQFTLFSFFLFLFLFFSFFFFLVLGWESGVVYSGIVEGMQLYDCTQRLILLPWLYIYIYIYIYIISYVCNCNCNLYSQDRSFSVYKLALSNHSS